MTVSRRLRPENTILAELFEDEIDLVKVWESEFPVKRDDPIRARHMNALWAALTERGRIVGLQVWDWTIGDKKGSSDIPTSSGDEAGSQGSVEREWNYPVHGQVRPKDEKYWDGFKENGTLIEATRISPARLNALLLKLDEVCQRYVRPDEERGFCGLSDLLNYCEIGQEAEDDIYWPHEFFTNSDHEFTGNEFPVVPDRTAADDENQLPSDERNAKIADRFLYERIRPRGTTRETIEINDPRFTIDGGGYGPAQGKAWLYSQPGLLGETITVQISSANKGDDVPETDEDTIDVASPIFHEQINAIYYMIRALEYYAYQYSGFPDPLSYFLETWGGKDKQVGFQPFCQGYQRPDKWEKGKVWIDFVNDAVREIPDNVASAHPGGAVLDAFAKQYAYFQCPGVGYGQWTCENRRGATFVPFIPYYRPWDSDYEQDAFPGGFPEQYQVQDLWFWLHGNYSTFSIKDSNPNYANQGWGGTAILLMESDPWRAPNGLNHFTRGLPFHEVKISGKDVGYDHSSGRIASPTILPRTIAEFNTDVFTVHWDLNPGKWSTANQPIPAPPKIQSGFVAPGNLTESNIAVDMRIATYIENHTYRGNKVEPEDMKL